MADRLAPAWLRVVWMFCHAWVAWPGHVARQWAVRGKPWCPGDEDVVVADGYPDRIGAVPDLAGDPRVERLGGGHLLNSSLRLSAWNRNTGNRRGCGPGREAAPSPGDELARRDSMTSMTSSDSARPLNPV
jgi:hypothetical protein